MLKKLIYLILFFPLYSFAQSDSGFVQFYIYPDDCDIKINNSLSVGSKSKVKLPVGENSILIKRKLLNSISENFVVVKDSTIQYRKILKYNEDYKKYQKELNWYYLHKISSTSIGVIGSSFLFYTAYSVYKTNADKQNDALNRGKVFIGLYNESYSIEEMNYYKSEFEIEKDKYYKYSKRKYSAIPLAFLGAGVGYLSYRYVKNIKKPTYIEPLSFNYNYGIDGVSSFSFIYKF